MSKIVKVVVHSEDGTVEEVYNNEPDKHVLVMCTNLLDGGGYLGAASNSKASVMMLHHFITQHLPKEMAHALFASCIGVSMTRRAV